MFHSKSYQKTTPPVEKTEFQQLVGGGQAPGRGGKLLVGGGQVLKTLILAFVVVFFKQRAGINY